MRSVSVENVNTRASGRRSPTDVGRTVFRAVTRATSKVARPGAIGRGTRTQTLNSSRSSSKVTSVTTGCRSAEPLSRRWVVPERWTHDVPALKDFLGNSQSDDNFDRRGENVAEALGADAGK